MFVRSTHALMDMVSNAQLGVGVGEAVVCSPCEFTVLMCRDPV